jgi:hypothetical protein
LSNNILDSLTKVRTVTYNWKANPSSGQMIGFLAQDLEQYFPQLVGTNEQGQKSVNYANMTPILVEAVRELNLKLTNLETVASTVNPSLLESIRTWLGDTGNGITQIFANTFTGNKVQVNELCVGTTCLNQSQVDQIINVVNQSGGAIPAVIITAPTPDTAPDTESVTTTDSGTTTEPVEIIPEVITETDPLPEETIPAEGV